MDGQDPTQILYHELMHLFLDDVGISVPSSGVVTVTVGDYTITYTNLRGANSGGLNAYDHLLVHDFLMDIFGSDKTGAYLEMMGITGETNGQITTTAGVTVANSNGATVTGSGLKATATSLQGTVMPKPAKPGTSLSSALSKYGTTCTPTKVAAFRHLHPHVTGDSFWTGEMYPVKN